MVDNWREGLGNISVVLFETRQPGNIGAASRAMKNMGIARLKLVNPGKPVNDECRMMAAGSLDIIEQALIYPNAEEALAEEQLLVGTTSHRDRRTGRRLWTPREVAPLIRREASQQRVAILFGSERGGLDDERLSHCQYLVAIPTSSEHTVLNLSQSVMILCYEILLAVPGPEPPQPALASQADREAMYAHLERTLLRIGYFSSQNRGHMMKSIRRLLGHLTRRDIRIIRGIMSQMDWFAEQGCRLPEEKVRKGDP